MAKYLNTEFIFRDRKEAGEQLAANLISYGLENPIVISLPRGGVPVAKPIAEKLNSTLDIMVSKKIGAPGNPELAMGAVTSHGDYVISSYSASELGEKKWDYIQKQIVYLVNECKEREKIYKQDAGVETSFNYPFQNKKVILVDDGTATGMTALAAIKSVKKQSPSYLILAIPVISCQAYDEIEKQVDRIETLKIPKDFIAVGVHYHNFDAVTDDEIKAMLV